MDGDGGVWLVARLLCLCLLSLLELAQDDFTSTLYREGVPWAKDADMIDPRPSVPNQSGGYAGSVFFSPFLLSLRRGGRDARVENG